MSIRLTTVARKDLRDYFAISGVFTEKKLTHTPFLVFEVDENNNHINVMIVDSAVELLEYPDNIMVMGQWTGKWRSDFFEFTVGDYRKFLQGDQPNSEEVDGDQPQKSLAQDLRDKLNKIDLDYPILVEFKE